MIASLRGTLIYNDATTCVVECGGVGYSCFLTAKALGKLPQKGEEVFLNTYMVVKEDAFELYGFVDREEMECFKLITSVSGVGAKIGISMLSAFTADQIALFIAGNDPKSLTAASGVGLKLAQRIILELKDKVSSISVSNQTEVEAVVNTSKNTAATEAVEALVSLGYTQSEASRAVSKLSADLSAEIMIKEALKMLMRMV